MKLADAPHDTETASAIAQVQAQVAAVDPNMGAMVATMAPILMTVMEQQNAKAKAQHDALIAKLDAIQQSVKELTDALASG